MMRLAQSVMVGAYWIPYVHANVLVHDPWGKTSSKGLHTMSCVSTSKPRIFITGGTGLIGGSFLHLMLVRGYLERFVISALTRRPADAQKLRELGVEPIMGSLGDHDLLRNISSQSLVVFNTAACDDLESLEAILAGLCEAASSSQQPPIIIHTSGAGVLSAPSRGTGVSLEEDTEVFEWNDSDVEAHRQIPPNAPHRHVDLALFKAADEGRIRTYLMVPPTVFGRGVGPFASHRPSIQLPRLVFYSALQRRPLQVGPGQAKWACVHTQDLAEYYMLLLDAALKDDGTVPHGRAGIFYPVTDHFVWKDVSKRIGEILAGKGLLVSSKVTLGSLPAGWFWGSNVIMRSDNARKLGWTPVHGGAEALLGDCLEWDAELAVDRGVLR